MSVNIFTLLIHLQNGIGYFGAHVLYGTSDPHYFGQYTPAQPWFDKLHLGTSASNVFTDGVEGSGKKLKKHRKNVVVIIVAIAVALFLLGCVVAAILLGKCHIIEML